MSGAARSLFHLLVALLLGLGGTAAQAQQAVRLPSVDGKPPAALAATLFKPAPAQGRAPAVALFHGCGGVGMNVTRMAQRLAGQGIAALVVDSFGPRRITDACTRNWPTVAQAADRTRDIDTAVAWLRTQPFVAADRIAVMGYSYGGGVVLMRSLRRELAVRAVIAVYPDCALPDSDAAPLAARQPTFLALAEKDDWTPVRQCEAMLSRLGSSRDQAESRVYAGAYHSFDAVGLRLTWLAAAGNRSKPNNCCGAHYGYDASAYALFLKDLDAFIARHLRNSP
ncbi:dienelactone hydrolase family protein [Vineibacter terrae]|uniref:dienelactone hydrolase family protein n=1 Tax=Vineibacter terrae TaxID=2586908 RepID=UPI002E317585|nr:dienelactone hydrolase family protein [Vineibacter terrae]HEX2890141.1 dienelactone hydrolase family protein [Vineibacter terrae]